METTVWSGLLADLSGNGNNGTFTGFTILPVLVGSGRLGKSLYFNGSWSAVEIHENTVLKSNIITMSVWFYGTANFSHYPYIITNWDPSSDGTWSNGIFLNIDNQKLCWAELSSPTEVIGITKGGVQEWVWYLWSVVFDGLTIKTYINNTLVGQIQGKDIFWNSEYRNLLIWRALWAWTTQGGYSDFHWYIDEVRIYNRALSDSEIQTLYNATK
jgi:hypothetical protein